MPCRIIDQAYLPIERTIDLIFDPETVIDKGTFEDPAQHPVGIRHVLVNGVAVLVDNEPIEGVAPGRAIRAPIAKTPASY